MRERARRLTLTGPLDLAKVQEIEQRAFQAWPGLEVVSCGGWLLRHAAGVTRRANSVWPNAREFGANLEDQLIEVERFYHARRLPARYQICPAMQPPSLDEQLSERGYKATARTAVQTTTVAQLCAKLAGAPPYEIYLQSSAPDAWWTCYAAADEVAPESVTARKAICAQIRVPLAYASIVFEGETVAVGSAAVEAGWIGFFNIATRREFRRRGAARALLAGLAQWGKEQRAATAYLQVMADNVPAQSLYQQLGFTTGYFYHYREEVRS